MKRLRGLLLAGLLALGGIVQAGEYREFFIDAGTFTTAITYTTTPVSTGLYSSIYNKGGARMLFSSSAMSGSSPSVVVSLIGRVGFRDHILCSATITAAGSATCYADVAPNDLALRFVVTGTGISIDHRSYIVRY